MLRASQLCPNDPKRLVAILFDLRSPKACERVHHLRAVWQAHSDLEALGPDHMVFILFPGTDRRITA